MLNTAAWRNQYLTKVKTAVDGEPARASDDGDDAKEDMSFEFDNSESLELMPSSDDESDELAQPGATSRPDYGYGGGGFEYRRSPTIGQQELTVAERIWNPVKQTCFRCCTPRRRNTLKKFLRRSMYYFFPIILWLPKYNWRENFLFDVAAGVACACLIIPQSLAYALLATVPPIMGLYTAWMPGMVFPCLTTSRHVSIGPDALGSLLVGLTLSRRPEDDPTIIAPLFALIIGLTMIIMGILSFGFLDNVLSRPLLSGFVNAVACIILIEQLSTFFGLPAPSTHDTTYQKGWYWLQNLKNTNFTTVGVGVVSLMVLIGFRLLRQFLPHVTFIKYIVETLIVVVCGIILSVALSLQERGVAVLGNVDARFPVPDVPGLSLAALSDNFAECMVIVIIGFVETIVAAKLFATKNNYRISPNRELVALGVSNMVGSFFHIYPTFGSLPRTAVVDYMGARSQLYSYVSATIVLLTIMFLAEFFSYLPRVVMSAIIIVAAYSLLELHDLVFLWKVKAWKDLMLLVFTFFITIILGVDLGIFIGMGISLLLVVRHTSFPRVSLMGQNEDEKWVDVSSDPKAKFLPGIIVVRIEEALYFANMEQIKDMFKRIEIFGRQDAHPADEGVKGDIPTGAIIIHAKNVQQMDASAMQTMCEMITEYQKQKIFVCFVKLKPSLIKPLIRAGIISAANRERVYNSMDEAVRHVRIYILKLEPEPLHEEGNHTQPDGTIPDASPIPIPAPIPAPAPSTGAPTPSNPDISAPPQDLVTNIVEPRIIVEDDASSTSSSSDG